MLWSRSRLAIFTLVLHSDSNWLFYRSTIQWTEMDSASKYGHWKLPCSTEIPALDFCQLWVPTGLPQGGLHTQWPSPWQPVVQQLPTTTCLANLLHSSYKKTETNSMREGLWWISSNFSLTGKLSILHTTIWDKCRAWLRAPLPHVVRCTHQHQRRQPQWNQENCLLDFMLAVFFVKACTHFNELQKHPPCSKFHDVGG